MSVTNIRVPASRHINEHRLSRYEKNPSFKTLSCSDQYKSREDYCKILGWELMKSKNPGETSYFYNNNTNQRADVFIKTLDTGERVYLPISDDPDLTLAYNLVISGCGTICYVRPNEWNNLGYTYTSRNRNRKKKKNSSKRSTNE